MLALIGLDEGLVGKRQELAHTASSFLERIQGVIDTEAAQSSVVLLPNDLIMIFIMSHQVEQLASLCCEDSSTHRELYRQHGNLYSAKSGISFDVRTFVSGTRATTQVRPLPYFGTGF